MRSQPIPIEPDSTYTLSCWVKGDSGKTTACVGFQAFDSAGKHIGTSYIAFNFAPGTTWVEKSGLLGPGGVAFPEGTTQIRIILMGKYNTNAPGYIWFDAVKLVKTSYLGGGKNVVSIDASGLNVGSAGRICGGALGYDSGKGFWMGYHGGQYKFFIGDSRGRKLLWDGSDLKVTGTINAVSYTHLTLPTIYSV